MSDTSRTPQESAEYLAKSLNDNTKALTRVQRRSRLLLALIVVVALTLGTVVKFNYDGNVSRCQAGNELRVEENEKWDSIVVFIEGANPELDEEERAFLALLDEDLELRDCSDVNWLGK